MVSPGGQNGRLLIVGVLAMYLQLAVGAQVRNTSATTEGLIADTPHEQLVVTASRMAQRAGTAPAAVTVFTEEDIRAMGATTLLDLLRYAPGVDVAEFNRSVSNVSIRGFNSLLSNKLLVMVDGRSIYLNYSGSTSWITEPLLLLRVKRVEIVRGPSSPLYGANAFNGVINIITLTPHELAGEQAKTRFRSMTGGYGTTLSEIQSSVDAGRGWFLSLGSAYNRSDGFGKRTPGNTRDSYTSPILTFDLEKRVRRGAWQLSLGAAESVTDFNDEFLYNDLDWKTRYIHLSYQENGVKNPITGRIFGNFINSDRSQNAVTRSQAYSFEVQQQRKLGAGHMLVYGAEHRDVLLFATNTGLRTQHESDLAFYVQDYLPLTRRTRLYSSLRLDDNSLHHANLTPRVSLLQSLSSRETMRMTWGTSFRTPTLIDNFIDITFRIPKLPPVHYSGDIHLAPERVTGYEVGYRRNVPGGFVGINAFYSIYSALLSTSPVRFTPPPVQIPIEFKTSNTGGARAVGFELEAQARLTGRTRALLNYAYQDFTTDGGQGVNLSPRHKLNVGVQTRLSARLDAFLGLHYVGAAQAHTLFSPVSYPLSDYTRIDARIAHRFGPPARPWTLGLIVTNLLDSGHYEFPLIPVPNQPTYVSPQRRTLYVTLEGKF